MPVMRESCENCRLLQTPIITIDTQSCQFYDQWNLEEGGIIEKVKTKFIEVCWLDAVTSDLTFIIALYMYDAFVLLFLCLEHVILYESWRYFVRNHETRNTHTDKTKHTRCISLSA